MLHKRRKSDLLHIKYPSVTTLFQLFLRYKLTFPACRTRQAFIDPTLRAIQIQVHGNNPDPVLRRAQNTCPQRIVGTQSGNRIKIAG